MTPGELLELFRLEVDDDVTPYLWSDDEFYAYLNEAHDLMIRWTGGIEDSTSPLTKLKYKAGEREVSFDERILYIKSIRDGNGNLLESENIETFELSQRGFSDDYGKTNGRRSISDSSTGTPRFLVNDGDANQLILYPLPDADGELRLRVTRTARGEITGPSDELEIPTHWHIGLLAWVKFRAYRKQDVETFDKDAANNFREDFMEYVRTNTAEKRRREDIPRVVSYGGI